MKALLIGTFAAFGLALLAYLQVAHTRKVQRQRGAFFESVEQLFTDARVRQDGINYPTLTGLYRGYPIKLEPIVDTVAFRKLPVLWLLVTHYRPLDVAAPLDILMRPFGTEFFSPSSNFEHDITPSADWPEHVRIASPAPSRAPALSAFLPFMGFIADPATKEVLVSAGGIRVVRQLAEGSQAHYRVTRRVELDAVELAPEQLAPVLSTLVEMGDALEATRRT